MKKLCIQIASIAGGAIVVGFFLLTITLAWMSHDLPDPNTLLQRTVAQSTKIYDKTGQTLLYEIHGDEKRTLVKLEDIPDIMKFATVAIEDKNFYSHHGVSWTGMARAFFTSVIKHQRVQGTSTLTQQFVKNAILTNERSIIRKLKEILLSLEIERRYTKDQILQLYLNEIPYGSTMYGVQSAAQGYFGKNVKDLTLDEAALLAAIPQAPDVYNPYGTGAHGDNRKTLIGRQHYILDQMAEQGYITKDQAEAAKKIDSLAKLAPNNIGDIRAPHFVMMVRSELIEQYGQATVETGGLNVITTLDWNLQQAAEKAVKDGVDARGKQYNFSNGSLVAMDPKTGQILAMVGSKDFFDEAIDGQVNVALAPRQPGSSFKPIVYSAGFERGYLPQTILWDVETDFKTETGNYHPHDYSFTENGPVSIRKALQGSLNIPAVEMLYLVGVPNVLDFAEKLGYSTFGDRGRFGLSLVLGGGEVTLLDHVDGYAAFANDGLHQRPISIIKVTKPDGSALQEWKAEPGTQVMQPQTARLVSNVLSDNSARAYVFGAGNSMTLPGRPVAAKTGTTNDFHDAWTLGYTPSIVAGVWVGNNDNSEMKRGADGSKIAAPIWKAFLAEAVKGTPVESFAKPAPPITTKPALLGTALQTEVKIDSVTGKLATEFTPPELVETRMFTQPHSILQYINKNDPTGPVPEHPEQDPQYANWEAAVQTWVAKNGWNTTSTPPTQYDDVHTKDNAPSVAIDSPSDNSQVNDRSLNIQLRINAQRNIRSAEASSNGYVLGTAYSANSDGSWTIHASIPNALEKGFQTIKISARDDVGNIGTAKITINLLANAAQTSMTVQDPKPGSSISMSDFPKTVLIQLDDMSNVSRADLYLLTPDGQEKLIGSNIKPQSNPVSFNWSFIDGPGVYTLRPRAAKNDGSAVQGDEISITVTPARPSSQPLPADQTSTSTKPLPTAG
ncbi:MAG: PBP1A family penicillin-binding protein [Patescibacteria group bacterium]